jgi:DNA-binding response OmpR family regulator
MRDVPLILVVDDVPDNVQIVQLRLESQSYGVITAADGGEALEKVKSALPDLILLDVMMPGKDGFTFCGELKRDPRFSSIPIVLLSARGLERDRSHGLALGATDFLTKPYSPHELRKRVRELLSGTD